jgi:methyl-accepting chemotaxis protein
MEFNNLKIGIRLGAGFGILIAMMLVMALVSVVRFSELSDIKDRIIEKDWVKAEAANVINSTTRANARRTMELVIATNPEQSGIIKRSIEANKKTIAQALETLENLIYLPEGKTLVAKLKEARGKYVASFTNVAKLVDEGKREDAIALLNAETLPALDAMQEPISGINDLQKKIVMGSSAEL